MSTLPLSTGHSQRHSEHIPTRSHAHTLTRFPPPALQVTYSPESQYLQFELDTEFVSQGWSIVVQARIQMAPGLPPITGRLKMDDIVLRGKVLMGLPLVSGPPGVAGVYVSFKERPHIEAKFTPLALPVSKVSIPPDRFRVYGPRVVRRLAGRPGRGSTLHPTP